MAQVERPADRAERMNPPVPHHAAAEVPPGPPALWMVAGMIFAPRSGAEPQVPVEAGRHRRGLLRPPPERRAPRLVSPGIIGQAAPRMDLPDPADGACPDPCAEELGADPGASLVPHLRDDAGF